MRQAQACRFSAAKLQIKTQIIIIYIYTSVINGLNKNRIPTISQSSGIQTARLQRNIRYKDRKPVYPAIDRLSSQQIILYKRLHIQQHAGLFEKSFRSFEYLLGSLLFLLLLCHCGIALDNIFNINAKQFAHSIFCCLFCCILCKRFKVDLHFG